MIADMGEIKVLDSLGERVRALRVTKGIDQIELARAVSELGTPIKNANISAIEKGKVTPSLPVLVNIAKALGDVSLDYLTMRTDVAETPAATDQPVYFSPEADEIARMVDAMTPYERHTALEHVRMYRRMAEERAAEIQPALDMLLMQLRAANLVLDEPALEAIRALVRTTFGVDVALPAAGIGKRDRAR